MRGYLVYAFYFVVAVGINLGYAWGLRKELGQAKQLELQMATNTQALTTLVETTQIRQLTQLKALQEDLEVLLAKHTDTRERVDLLLTPEQTQLMEMRQGLRRMEEIVHGVK